MITADEAREITAEARDDITPGTSLESILESISEQIEDVALEGGSHLICEVKSWAADKVAEAVGKQGFRVSIASSGGKIYKHLDIFWHEPGGCDV